MLHKWWLLVAVLASAALVKAETEAEEEEEEEEEETEAAGVTGGTAQLQAKESSRECFGGGGEDGEDGEDGEAVALSVESGLNATGHWLAKVRLQHVAAVAGAEAEGAGGEGERGPVQLQLRRWARRGGRQGHARLITLQATLAGPSASSKKDLPWNDKNTPCPAGPGLLSRKDTDPQETTSSPAASCPTCPAPPPPPAPLACPSPCPPPAPCPTSPAPPPPPVCPSPCPPPAPCPTCPAPPPSPVCPSPCPPPAPCPTCPAPSPPPAPPACPSPCPPPCPSPAPCPACLVPPTPAPMECPSPCATPPPCPTCPSCPACPAPRACPSPCATSPPCPTCPSCPKPTVPGYERHSGHGAYRLHLTSLNWFEAQATCEREGAHLAVINSQAEADILARILRSQPISLGYVLMGFHDLYSEGAYYTVLDKPLHTSGYYKWKRGEPNNGGGNEDCGGMYVDVMGLNDHHCHQLTAPFICEMP